MDKDKIQKEVEKIRKLTPEQFAEKFDNSRVQAWITAGDDKKHKRATDSQNLLLVAATDLQLIAAAKKYFEQAAAIPDIELAGREIEELWNQRAELIKSFGLDFNTDQLSPEALMEIGENIRESCKTHQELKEGSIKTGEPFGEGNINKA